MIDLSFDNGTVEQFTLVLSTRDGTKLGQLSNIRNLKFTHNLNATDELSFEICKQLDDHEEILWDDVFDLRLVWVPELEENFEIRVELTDQVYKTKTITCTSLCECELSQAGLYNIEINTAEDIARSDYDVNFPTVFYRILPQKYIEITPIGNENPYERGWLEKVGNDYVATTDTQVDSNKQYYAISEDYKKRYNSSLLHRILDKVPAYSIAHVDSSLMNLQRTFSISNTTVYDFLTGDCSDQFNCIFIFDSVNRTVSAYDLYTVCQNPECGHRGDFRDACPKCGSTNLKYFGEDTTIFVSTENLTDEVTFETDVDSIKNAFRLEAGDDNMTAAVVNSNPTGSRYIYEFSDEARRDMPEELVSKMDDYDVLYNEYNTEYEISLDSSTVAAFNDIAEKYSLNTCQLCGNRGHFTICPECHSQKVTQTTWEQIPSVIKGYQNLIPFYYECIDLYSYLKSSMMPQVIIEGTTARAEADKINAELADPSFILGMSRVASSTTLATANIAMVNYVKTIIKTGFVKVTVDTDSANSFTYVGESGGINTAIWYGRFKITNFADDTDYEYTNFFSIDVNDKFDVYIEEKIVKQLLSKCDDDAYDVLSMIAKRDDDPTDPISFKNVIRLYSSTRLQSFHDAIEAVIGILIDAGQGVPGTELYTEFYTPYYTMLVECEDELNLRNHEIEVVWGSYDMQGLMISDGMIQYIATEVTRIHKALNFQDYVGEELYKIYTTYIREQTYTNSNYISDGLDNNQLFDNARQFLARAKEELHKSATYQHSIKSNLNNLLAIKEFKPLLNKFNLGNWIRVQADETIYRLRLISYSIDFDSLQKINTEFSDVTITANGLNDIQSIIKQASSMSSSYGYVEKQAEQGSTVKIDYIDDWVANGLNSALVRINNNNDEDIRIDNAGITARTYDDISEEYDAEQMRITHNVIAFTDDNWESVKTALGKFEMTHHSINSDGINTNASAIDRYTDYGLVANAVLAGWIVGSHMESSNIIASHFQAPGNKSYIDMTTETTGERKYFIKCSYNGEDKFTVDKSGNAQITGKVTATSGKIGNWTILRTDSTYFYGAGALYYKDNESDIMGYNPYTALLSPKGCTMKPGANQTRFGWKAESANDEETFILGVGQHFGVNTEGRLYAKDINVSGKIIAESGQIGAWHVDPLSVDPDDYVVGSGALYYNAGNATNTYLLAPNSTKNNYSLSNVSARKWNIRFGNNFGIDTSGNAFLCGTIYADAGKIGDFVIKSESNDKYLGNELGSTVAVGMRAETSSYRGKIYAWYPSYTTIIYPGLIEVGAGGASGRGIKITNGVYRDSSSGEGGTSGSNYIFINWDNIYNKDRDTTVVWHTEISDKNAKKDIKKIDNKKIQDFFSYIEPSVFKFKKNIKTDADDKMHYGVIAQNIEYAADKSRLSKETLVKNSESNLLCVNYQEFHGIQLAAIKDLYEIVNVQQTKIDLLQEEIKRLKGEQ